MNETLALVLSWLAGAALGAFFFGGLWWTVRKSLVSRQPAVWVFCSLLLRMGATMTGFYFVAGADWRRLLACVIGFFMARHIVLRLTRTPEEILARKSQEARHAP
ncbi:ATP synthase subunit I [Polaromonas sp.]|uniref:ATP synthase subunit I n=1 Tax=Polaromonas sp. TaxID=1869339 RepID=UPI0013BCCD0D|nr:ATP synthase subunit I [Polaromonas sp.]NDP64336.1 ATP synthase subunit I [Polaromonas sp.]